MTTIKEVFAQQLDQQEKAWDNIIEVSGVIEAAGIDTYAIKQRSTVFLAVRDHHYETAFKMVYHYWHKGNATLEDQG